MQGDRIAFDQRPFWRNWPVEMSPGVKSRAHGGAIVHHRLDLTHRAPLRRHGHAAAIGILRFPNPTLQKQR